CPGSGWVGGSWRSSAVPRPVSLSPIRFRAPVVHTPMPSIGDDADALAVFDRSRPADVVEPSRRLPGYSARRILHSARQLGGLSEQIGNASRVHAVLVQPF